MPQFGFFLRDVTDTSDPNRVFSLSAADVALINPNTRTAPVFRTRRDAELAQRVYGAFPVLLKSGQVVNPWDVALVREFNMTSESHKFLKRLRPRRERGSSGAQRIRRFH